MPGTALGHELFNDMAACWNRAPVSWNIFLLFQNTVSTFTGVFTPQLKVWFSGEQRKLPSGAHLHPIFQLSSWRHLFTAEVLSWLASPTEREKLSQFIENGLRIIKGY